jgi:hypothetical protein
MAFPAIVDTRTTNDATSNTLTPWISIPFTTLAGDLLIAAIRLSVLATVTWPDGWNELVDANDGSDGMSVAWRIATAAEESADQINVTVTVAARSASVMYRITGFSTPPECSTPTTGTGSTPDAGSLSPTGGSKDYLWITFAGIEGEPTEPTVPSGYSQLSILFATSGTAGGAASNCAIAAVARQLAAASHDSGAWTFGISDQWMAFTVAVHPAVADTWLARPASSHGQRTRLRR